MKNDNLKTVKFIIFIIYRLAEKWHEKPSHVYKILSETNIIKDYIIREYDVLHTLGTEYLVEDITEFVYERSGQRWN